MNGSGKVLLPEIARNRPVRHYAALPGEDFRNVSRDVMRLPRGGAVRVRRSREYVELFVPECDHRIDLGCTPCRKITSKQYSNG
jgi:hypothetical protein